MNNILRVIALILGVLFPSHHILAAELPFLHPLFSEGAVLQRDVALPVWGWTKPGAAVTVSIGKVKASAIAGADGRWQAVIAPSVAGGPFEMSVSGPTNVTVKNVLFGDVWLCSGQSNMEMGLGETTNGQAEIGNANFPKIRLLAVPRLLSQFPMQTADLKWSECRPDVIRGIGNTSWGGFSAAAYFFGRDLHRELNVPIGLVTSSFGGTMIEGWSSARALRKVGRFNAELDRMGMSELEWLKKFDPGSTGVTWAKPTLDDSKWKTMNLPARWEQAGLPGFDGVVWFRREVKLPPAWAGKELQLNLGPIDDADTTWFNGYPVGATTLWSEKRRYRIPAKLVKPGSNMIAVRALDRADGGGMFGKPEYMGISQTSNPAALLPLAGAWKYQPGVQFTAKVKPPDVGPGDGNASHPTVLYNGMIAPLEPFPFKGFFWYQGESNADNAGEYEGLLSNMITDLRQQFRSPNLPAIIVQLPNFQPPQQKPVEEGAWVNVREAQLDVMRKIPNTMLVVTIDIGHPTDIHPPNKLDVGRRAALAALGKVYGRDIIYSGPIYRSLTIKGSRAQLEFDHVGKGLASSSGGPLTGFAIAGADGRFVEANVEIEGTHLSVWADAIPKPTAVRYNWALNPYGNLTNASGLPASPFRTDHP